MISGIYSITAPSNKCYIGSTNNFGRRWHIHQHQFRRGTHHCIPLQRAWDKYGESITFTPIIICEPQNLILYEQLAIDALKPEYNIAKVAGSSRGIIRSKKTKNKIAATLKGRVLPKETREKMSLAHIGKLGRPHTEEAKQKIGAASRLKVMSAEARAKVSAAFIGKARSEATKLKIAEGVRAFWAAKRGNE